VSGGARGRRGRAGELLIGWHPGALHLSGVASLSSEAGLGLWARVGVGKGCLSLGGVGTRGWDEDCGIAPGGDGRDDGE
jgi:hypothetical protein